MIQVYVRVTTGQEKGRKFTVREWSGNSRSGKSQEICGQGKVWEIQGRSCESIARYARQGQSLC